MASLIALLKRLLGRGESAPPEREPPAEAPEPAQKSFFEKLLGDAATIPDLDDARREAVLRYFATDSCERFLLLEKHVRGSEDDACFRLLDAVRKWIAEGAYPDHLGELEERIQEKARSLDENDARHLLWTALFQLCARDPEQMADQAFFHTMLRLVRYGGPFVDAVRARERAWHEARLAFWLQHGARAEDMAAAYATPPAVSVPEEASLQHGIRPRGD